MSVANVKAFWEKLRSYGNTQLFHELWDIVHHLPREQVPKAIIRLGGREGFQFSSDDYRLAIIEGIEAQPDTTQELAKRYRGMVAEGRWFEVVDGVVVGG
jgi:uncharacterized protein YlzI (FlbEa/FlbD family)